MPRCARSCADGCAALHDEINVTSIFVTHDQEEALEVANRVVVMDKGKIEQIGSPDDVYESPATAFVHGFIGESIELPVQVDDGVIRLGDRPLGSRRTGLRLARQNCSCGDTTCWSARPAAVPSRAPCSMSGISVRCSGPRWHCQAARPIEIDAPRDRELRAGDTIGLEPRRYRIFAAIVIRSSRPGISNWPIFASNFPQNSPFSHGWYATTAPHWGLSTMRAAAAILIALLLAGCAGNEAPVQQPTMYADMAVPGAKLDAQAAAIMISQYRQNNGLGTVVVDPDLMRLAESQSKAMAAANKMDHDVRAPLAKRLSAPAAIRRPWRSRTSRPAIIRWRKRFPAGATRPRTAPTCSRAVSQNWASRRAMLPAPNTRCSGP